MMDLQDPLALSMALMREPSITPEAAGSFNLIQDWLEALGFQVWRQVFADAAGAPTENLYARRGAVAPNLCYAGHVDVVPPGDEALWESPPFDPQIRADYLYGRGAEDMKVAICCYIAAIAQADAAGGANWQQGSLSFLLTADEEGDGINGTRPMLDWLQARGEVLDGCIIGEPTNPTYIGEMAKIGRRGSVGFTIEVAGKQGHVAYPDLADNPLPRMIALLHALTTTPIDEATEFFPASNLEVTTMDVGNKAVNVIPAMVRAQCNIRFNEQHSGADMVQWVEAHAKRLFSDSSGVKIMHRISGESFLSPPGALAARLVRAVQNTTGHTPALTATGGTSDARFIQAFCPVIEFGTTNYTAHMVNERVKLTDIQALCAVYLAFLQDRAGD